MGLIEVGPSMDLVVRRHRLPNDSLKKVAMKTTSEQPKKKVGGITLSSDIKGLKRERHEAKKRKVGIENEAKKRKTASD
ncbi:hypothetical protein BHE74_00050089 [Ensete ventricosum]|uniref:Ribosome biogenesis protein RPF2 homolog n=1 Tax=Ensete ventricosum TaxID=4639 RepID=A0A426YSV3_ENSVE|nr:hypothetical protein B296_00048876 [Ensete ventricosum]RWW44172.1 hypothetical protein BHE74_00050089 [Ensete ventricosum]